MSRNKAKFSGQLESSQKTITNFFKPVGNSSGGDKASSSSAGKNANLNRRPGASSKCTRRKSCRFLKPANAPNIVEVVDLANSDGEDFYCVVSGGSGSALAYEEAVKNVSTKVPVVVLPFDPSIQIKNEVIQNGAVGNEGLPTRVVEEDNAISSAISVGSEQETPQKDLIRIVNYSSILDSSQSSQSSCASSSAEITPTKDLNIEIFTISDDSAQSSSKTKVFATPAKKKEAPSSSSSPSPARKTPIKSSKSRVNHFSPVRQLFRSKSKTPVKSPKINFQNFPARETVMKSPLKSLWSQRSDPYYLRNFMLVLNSVLDDKTSSHLINLDDRHIIEKFMKLDKPAKCLLMRLVGRTWKWLRVAAVKYPDIGENLDSVFQELHREEFLSEIADEELPIEEVLDLVPAPKLPELCKGINVKIPGISKTKKGCTAALIASIKNQRTLSGSLEKIISVKARKEVGSAYKLKSAPRDLFQRLFILFSPPQYWEQNSDKDQLQLLSMLLQELGKVQYPKYKINRTRSIYSRREDLIQFQEAWNLFGQMVDYTDSKQWDEVVDVAEEAMEKFKLLLQNSDQVEQDKIMPAYLRIYVAGSLLAKICSLGVEGFQKLKHYEQANQYLKFLLDQSVYLPQYRGRWFERLIVNSTHVKLPQGEVIKLVKIALENPCVGNNYKLDFHSRLNKLQRVTSKKQRTKRKPKRKARKKKKKNDEEEWCQSSSSSDFVSSSESEEEMLLEENLGGDYLIRHPVPEITIEGEKMPIYGDQPRGKSVFLGSAQNGNTLSSVENFVLQHFRQDGYVYGVHAEGAVPSTIYGLIFWDVIYNQEVPDVFFCPYQAYPLDLFCTDFRTNRKLEIENRLAELKNCWTADETLTLMRKHWTENMNTLSIVHWDLFSDFSIIETLVGSLGLPLIAGICDRLSDDYRYYRSGFPDLIVWNEKKYRIVEVKGPNDKLSTKQRLWIDYLLSLNAVVEVCHVKSLSNKRLRPSK